jgi:hypothetical protein
MVSATAPLASVSDELIQVIPSALWALVLILALSLFREPIRSLLGRIESSRLKGSKAVRLVPFALSP